MDYVNFWTRPITLPLGSATASLDLPDGTYRLVIANAPTAATAWEVIDAAVVAGAATLTRGLEGTDEQDWPFGSVVACTVTAGVLQALAGAGGGLSGAGVPALAPESAGATYVDITAPALFVSQGTASLDDWRQVGGAPYYEYLTFDGIETPVQIARWVRRVTLESEVYEYAGLVKVVLPAMGGGAEAIEHMEINISNTDSAGYELQLDFTAMVSRLALTGMSVETNLATVPAPTGGVATFSLTGDHVISISAGFQYEDEFNRWGLLRVVVEDAVSLNSGSGPI